MMPVLLLLLLVLSLAAAEVLEEGGHNLRAEQHGSQLAHLATLTADTWPENGPWIVEVEHGSHASVQAAAKATGGAKVKVKDIWEDDASSFNGLAIAGLKRADLLNIAGVKSVLADRVMHTTVTWGQDRIDQPNRLPRSHSYTPLYPGCGVDVYIIDTGMDSLHPELAGPRATNIFNAFGPITPNTDGNTHGTHVAGTVGGYSVGVSPCASIFALKALDDEGFGAASDIITAITIVKKLHKENGRPSVLSLGFSGACFSECSDDALLVPLLEIMKAGVVVVASAGNEDSDALGFLAGHISAHNRPFFSEDHF